MWRSENNPWESVFSLIPGIKFMSSGLAKSAFIHPSISLILGHFEQKTNYFISFLHLFIVCVVGEASVGCMWKSEDHFWESVLFCCVVSGDWTRAVSLDSRCPSEPSCQPTTLGFFLFLFGNWDKQNSCGMQPSILACIARWLTVYSQLWAVTLSAEFYSLYPNTTLYPTS